ncbi:MAG: GNAT family N-acetyltransferase [Breznakibacter sp.]
MIIRKAVRSDANDVARHLLLAMEEIVFGFIGERSSDKAKAFMCHFAAQTQNQYSYQNCWVGEEGNEVVAAINVYDGADLHRLRAPVIAYLKKQFGRDVQPEDETQAGEFYIDTLGVDPRMQGKGIGSQMLWFVIDEFVHRRKLSLGLLVEKANPRAKELYVRLGFSYAGEKTLIGKPMEHLQMKNE